MILLYKYRETNLNQSDLENNPNDKQNFNHPTITKQTDIFQSRTNITHQKITHAKDTEQIDISN